jgi:uncharacterized protein (TIGR01777 family)
MRIIITGGSGLIGRALTQDLASDGHEIIILSRTPNRILDLPAGARAEKWNGRSAEGWGHLAEGADAIVNLAGLNLAGKGFFPTRWTEHRKQLLRDSRVNSGHAVVEAVEQAGMKPRVVIQASGIDYYGSHADEKVTEEVAPGTGFLARLAADDWEPSTAPVEEMGVRRAIIRSGAVLDVHEGALPRLIVLTRLALIRSMGSGRQWLPWIHITDEARAIRFLIDNDDLSGPFNLVAPNALTNAQFVKTLARVVGRPALLPVPSLAIILVVGEVADVLLEGRRAVPERLLQSGFQFRFPEAEPALRDLLK